MRRFAGSVAAVSVFVVLAGSLVGCSSGEKKAVPRMPKRICWDVFASSDVSPILPPGERVNISDHPFALTEDYRSVSCLVYIDGNTKFMADVSLGDFEGVDWSSFDKADPKPIDVGEKGIFWGTGASAYFTCEPSKGPNSPGKYIDLYVSSDGAPDKSKLPTVLPKLLRQLVEFVRRELKCGAGGGS
ncbi:hypothetical protein ACFV1C_24585 [Streptomyces sp. NPDC059605]|uniref:hypothetical protein n=1 Tax=unclassified Streptomyces TaxID=2593676 RepID=UPI0036A326E3